VIAEIERLSDLLADRKWRLSSLYSIRDRWGRTIPFRPNHSQTWFEGERHLFTLLTKSRQHGFSTYEAIDTLDECLFGGGNRCCGLIDKRIEDAKGKLATVAFAYETIGFSVPGLTPGEQESLRDLLHQAFPLASKSERKMVWENGSSFSISTSFRGGTLQRLWVSEFGYIAIHRPLDAQKILSGAIPAIAEGNRCTFESTHEGGKYGEHSRLIEEASKRVNHGPKEFKFLFIPFWQNPDNSARGVTSYEFREEELAVFSRWEKQGISLTLQQKAFWANENRTLPKFSVFREFPAVVEDMFMSPVDGAIYADVLTRRELLGRVCAFDVSSRYPSYVAWDLGGANTAIWHVQDCPDGLRWLNYHQGSRVDLSEYLRIIDHWHSECPIVRHLLPHDAAGTEKDGRTFKTELIAAGARNLVVVPQCRSVWQGIGELWSLFETSWFHERLKTKFKIHGREGSAWDYLTQYKVEQVPEGSTLQRMPKKDHTSHAADSARTFAEAKLHGLLTYAHTQSGYHRGKVEVIGL
jgi:hypothetical protein